MQCSCSIFCQPFVNLESESEFVTHLLLNGIFRTCLRARRAIRNSNRSREDSHNISLSPHSVNFWRDVALRAVADLPPPLPTRHHRCRLAATVADPPPPLPTRRHRCRPATTVADPPPPLPTRHHRCRPATTVADPPPPLPTRHHRCRLAATVADSPSKLDVALVPLPTRHPSETPL